jgi:hypothetical protein
MNAINPATADVATKRNSERGLVCEWLAVILALFESTTSKTAPETIPTTHKNTVICCFCMRPMLWTRSPPPEDTDVSALSAAINTGMQYRRRRIPKKLAIDAFRVFKDLSMIGCLGAAQCGQTTAFAETCRPQSSHVARLFDLS